MGKIGVDVAIRSAFIYFLFFASAFAQGVTGTVRGQIVDQYTGSGVTDASVTMSDPRTGLRRTATTNSAGRFQMQLVPGDYVLSASATNYSAVTIQEVAVDIAAVRELRIALEQGAIEEIVVVGQPLPQMEMATGETGLHLTMAEVAKLPVPRNIEAIALMAPGTVPGARYFGEGTQLVSFGGASVAENVYYIDGLNVTDFRWLQGGSSVPFEFYDQFQIKTGGYSAEFGRSTGGVLNAMTKRGGNEFEFGVVAYTAPEWLQGASPDTLRPDGSYYDFNSENTQSSTTVDLYVSGPILRDELFFFLLYEPQSTTEDYNWFTSPDVLIEKRMESDFWGGNLTWNITDNHSLSYTAFSDERETVHTLFEYDLETREKGAYRTDGTYYRGGGNNFIVRYDGQLMRDLAVSALHGKVHYDQSILSSNDFDCPRVVDVSDSSEFFLPGCWGNGGVERAWDRREAYRLDVVYTLGDHTIRAGLDREDNVSFNAFVWQGFAYAPDLVGGVYYRYETYDVGDQLDNGAIVPDVNGDGSRVDTVRYEYLQSGGTFDTLSHAWYLEDTWEISDALTVSAGVRNEVFENYNGVGDLFFDITDQWAPRLALSWSPRGRGEQRINLNWGRYHLPIPALPNIVLGEANLQFDRYFVYDGNRDERTAAPISIDENGVPTTQELGSIIYWGDGSVADTRSGIDATLEPMYQDEWIIAYERDISSDWTVGVRYINRELKSLIEDVLVFSGLEAIGFPGAIDFTQPCAFVMTNPGTDIATYCDADGDGELEETFISAEALGYPKPRRTYRAVELVAEGSVGDRWTLQGSYTWSKNEGNVEGGVKSDIGQGWTNLTTDFDFPQLMDGAYGYLPNDRRHKLRLWGTYQATDRLLLSARVFAQSGRPVNAFGISHPDGRPFYGDTFYLQQPDGTFEFKPRGTSGRTAWVTQVDLAAIYNFDWGDRGSVELRAEVFNLFNSDSEMEVYEHYEERPDQFKLPKMYQDPRQLRFGIAMRF